MRQDEQLTHTCHCSYLEIYKEQVFDLLDDANSDPDSRVNLQVRKESTRTSVDAIALKGTLATACAIEAPSNSCTKFNKKVRAVPGHMSGLRVLVRLARCEFRCFQVREDPHRGVFVENLKEVEVTCMEEVLGILNQVVQPA